MPHRDDASFYRPRLYDGNDPKMPDEVSVVLGALEDALADAMEDEDTERVKDINRIIDRMRRGSGYEDTAPAAAEAGA